MYLQRLEGPDVCISLVRKPSRRAYFSKAFNLLRFGPWRKSDGDNVLEKFFIMFVFLLGGNLHILKMGLADPTPMTSVVSHKTEVCSLTSQIEGGSFLKRMLTLHDTR